MGFLADLEVGILFLELATPRAGEIEVLRELPRRFRIGVGVVNQKRAPVETALGHVVRAAAALRGG